MSDPTKVCPTCLERFPATDAVCPEDGAMLVYTVPGEEDLVDKIVDGRYRVIDLIAEGGMGRVYRATQLSMDRTVALKVLKRSLSSDVNALRRFQNEARASSALKNPHTVMVLDFGQEPSGLLYLAMEYVDGASLADRIRTDGPFPAHRAVNLACQILESLAEAHEQQIIHRDIKPANILVTETATGQEWAKVTDFGIAKIISDDGSNDLTQTGMLVGTPQYISPEQVRGQPLDLRCDLYAVGIVLYEMLVGRPPFHGKDSTPAEVLMRHLDEQPRSVAVVRPNTDATDEVLNVMSWGLMKDPNQRPQSAREFRDGLQKALAGVDSGQTAKLRDDPLLPTVTMPQLSVPTDEIERGRSDSDLVDTRGPVASTAPNRPLHETDVVTPNRKTPTWKLALFMVILVCGGIGLGFVLNRLPDSDSSDSEGGEKTPIVDIVDAGVGPEAAADIVEASGPDTVTPDVVSAAVDISPTTAEPEPEPDGAIAHVVDVAAPPVAFVTLEITSTPVGARVSVDGTRWGVSPVALKIPKGETRKVIVSKNGYNSKSKVLTAESTSPIFFRLKKKEDFIWVE